MQTLQEEATRVLTAGWVMSRLQLRSTDHGEEIFIHSLTGDTPELHCVIPPPEELSTITVYRRRRTTTDDFHRVDSSIRRINAAVRAATNLANMTSEVSMIRSKHCGASHTLVAASMRGLTQTEAHEPSLIQRHGGRQEPLDAALQEDLFASRRSSHERYASKDEQDAVASARHEPARRKRHSFDSAAKPPRHGKGCCDLSTSIHDSSVSCVALHGSTMRLSEIESAS
jgi:hypothetical protein